MFMHICTIRLENIKVGDKAGGIWCENIRGVRGYIHFFINFMI